MGLSSTPRRRFRALLYCLGLVYGLAAGVLPGWKQIPPLSLRSGSE